MIFGGLTAADAIAKPIGPAQPTRLEETAADQKTDASVGTAASRAQSGSTSYQVVFNSADGSSIDSQNVKDGALASRPEQDPTRDGYLFDGWFAKDAKGDSKVAYDFTQPVTTDLTLTAHWTKGTSAWSLSPASGKTRGYAKITLTPPTKPDIRFSHIIPAKEEGSQAIASDGNLYRWGDNNYKLETPEDEKRTPSLVNPPTGVHFTQVSTGYSHFLAIGSDGNLYSWGHNADGELGRETVSTTPKDNPQIDNQPKLVTPPAGVHFTQACAGKWHSLALGSDGNLYSWGENKYGELGRDTGSAIYDVKPGKVNLPKGITKITQISAGTFYSMALDSDGDLYSWGDNTYDELGRYAGGYPFRDRSPRKMIMPAGVKKFTWIKAGEWTSLATSSDGSLYSWGWNEYGQLGRNTAPARQDRTPRKVTMPAGVTKFTQVSTEHRHSLALGSDGNLYSWGLNDCEQLGRDTGSAKYDVKPGKVPTPAGAAQFTEVSAGYSHSLAIGSDGNLYSWGQNKYGELGRPTSGKYDRSPGMVAFPEDPKPVNVSFGGAPGTNLDPNSDGTWSVTTPQHDRGRVDVVITWKMNGERPDAHLSYRYLDNYLIIFDPDGGNGFGFQIVTEGNRLKPPAKDPTKNKHLFDGWFVGNIAYDFSRPVTGTATLTAHWSSADSNRWKLDKDNGPETGGQTVTLTPPPERGIRLSQADAGDLHSAAVGSDGSLYTWGDNDSHGQLGRDTAGKQDSHPSKADTPAGVNFIHVSAGYGFSVALGSDGSLYSWGDNAHGELGRTVTSGTPANRPNKVETPAGITFVQASAGGSHAVALGSDGNIYTWGDSGTGRLGRTVTSGSPADKPDKADTPADVTFTSVSAGQGHTVAVDTQGEIYTWGDNTHGELGRNTTSTPADKPGRADTPAGVTFTQASAGGSHSVAVSDDGSLYTWGNAANGRLGRDANSTPADKPGRADAPAGVTFTQASAGGKHSIALGSDGSLYTWGDSGKTSAGRPNKVDTPAGITFTQASADASYCLALGSDGNLYSWGDNAKGQLGRDTGDTWSASPAKDNFPELGIPTHVLFDNVEASDLTRNPDGTWTVATPAHMPGISTVTIEWRLSGADQTPDTSNTYRYNSISVLPRAGGGGLVPLLIAGLLAFACAAAARRHRLETLSRQQ
ncbi:RCC1 domain-containing protein [Bifidobacterium sp. ESL0822]|uniref:RCC1 domain-containing protein n=1 Tax=Bifidobacterium sp. ESL0822 TaxID=3448585 RepID=UPI0040424BED